MTLLPFQSNYNEDGMVVCPVCLHEQDAPLTKFCTDKHPVGLPDVSIRMFEDLPEPHLHRSCVRCGYTWLEQTAEDLTGRPTAE